ncbi:bromodomain-containing protein DDB_G0280777-like [Oppia nitens]|uniref:bromodomain-containing protein DDB_G0280777-like n=1 Tax=Oppia nitens TaxID=1686743 RepID=UPI0023DCE21C|nr:bromodomain-containing protein DDB_G0280777-like [Oppia nitens]
MFPKLFVISFVITFLLQCIDCQQMVTLLRSASNQNPQTAQPSSSQTSKPQSQPQQPQLLSLEQQQQLLQQLALLTAQQQRQQSQPQIQFLPQQAGAPQQPFFDPSTGQQFFGPQGSGAPQQQQFFNPNQFLVQPHQQQFSGQPVAASPTPTQTPSQSQAAPAQGPQINWGKCLQLEPSEKEKQSKAQVITKCLETTPLPPNITRETVELHREQIAACALQSEGWFLSNGGYDFGKAENEIKNKKLTKQIENQVIGYHKQCKEEAEEKFPTSKNTVIAQIQLYQACMDYFISDVCGIEVMEAETPQFTGPTQ